MNDVFNFTKKFLIFAILVTLSAFIPIEKSTKQKVEVVFCLDLSASTNGLLNDIRDNLWQFAKISKNKFPNVDLKIGIVAFARPSFGAENNYVKILSDITDDFDLISYYLFLLRTNIQKGDQCDGSALYASLRDLHWNKDPSARKMIFIFGNSNVKMCGYDYMKACEIASKENISIHAIYCSRGVFINKYFPMWNEIAETTGGNFDTYFITDRSPLKGISKEAKSVSEWNENLSDTYIPFIKEGKLHYDLMIAADENSKIMSEQFFIDRCNYKFSEKYEEQCSEWDLVTRMQSAQVDLSTINRKYLPLEFQNTTPKELAEIVKIKTLRREVLKSKMQKIITNAYEFSSGNNPIDSIFLSGLNKQPVFASGIVGH